MKDVDKKISNSQKHFDCGSIKYNFLLFHYAMSLSFQAKFHIEPFK